VSLFPEQPDVLASGLVLHRGLLDGGAQAALVETIRAVLRSAPLFTPVMPGTGKPFSVRTSNCGPLGWVSDTAGYRYQPTHPETEALWPAMPDALLELWWRLSDYPAPPEACLINWYEPTARMGLHQDRDELAFDAPVLSISLGNSCLFRFGGTKRSAPTRSIKLLSGDVLVIGGDSRLCFHGVDRIHAGTSALLPKGGRINLTLRRVNPAA
jgi:alkylated DNA repair protein (DNA oxidative demethylase)